MTKSEMMENAAVEYETANGTAVENETVPVENAALMKLEMENPTQIAEMECEKERTTKEVGVQEIVTEMKEESEVETGVNGVTENVESGDVDVITKELTNTVIADGNNGAVSSEVSSDDSTINSTSGDLETNAESSSSTTHTTEPSMDSKPKVLPSTSSVGSDTSFNSRLLSFHNALNQEKIPRTFLQDFIFEYGVPDGKNLRSLCWKLLLDYLPYKKEDWESSLQRSRQTYANFIIELCVNPFKSEDSEENESDPNDPLGSKRKSQLTAVAPQDDPLAVAPQNKWVEYYKDEEIRHEIDKDVKRTYSSFHFFNERVKPIQTTVEEMRKQEYSSKTDNSSVFQQNKAANSASMALETVTITRIKNREDETHQDVLKRILFIYAKLNPGVRYVQGMNEILAPMYYIFAQDTQHLFAGHAESDAFFCFTNVMSDIRDRFIKSLDSSPSGVLAVVRELNELLRDVDEELWAHLETHKVDPRFYSFRWITLLLSQEFELPEVIRLWDSLFADRNRFQFLLFCCCSMLVCVRDRLLDGDFADALKLLQHYGDNRIEFLTILGTATKLKQEWDANRAKGTLRSSKKSADPPSHSHKPHNSNSNSASPRPTSSPNSHEGPSAAQVAATKVQAASEQLFKSVSSFFKKK